jgi:antitoxin (DNA-binding transcriptional repressor) of toxin-antitoxin stability system
VGSHEVKTKLPELLRCVQAGKRYTITLRGEAVADLVPPAQNQNSGAVAVEQMRAFMEAAKPVAWLDLKAQTEQGRA